MTGSTTVPHDTDPDRPDGDEWSDAVDPGGPAPPDTVVPAGVEPHTCPYCSRPFRESDTLALHVGAHHADRHSAAEREAYESAREAEGDELFMYHLRVIAALGVLYALLVLVYMIVLA